MFNQILPLTNNNLQRWGVPFFAYGLYIGIINAINNTQNNTLQLVVEYPTWIWIFNVCDLNIHAIYPSRYSFSCFILLNYIPINDPN